MNTYIKSTWNHDSPDDPSEIYYELDADRFELRCIEIYANGIKKFLSIHDPDTADDLSYEAIPSLEDINVQPEFIAEDIEQSVFDELWAQR